MTPRRSRAASGPSAPPELAFRHTGRWRRECTILAEFPSMTERIRTDEHTGSVDGGEGRGVPLDGLDEVPPTGYRSTGDEELEPIEDDFLWEEGDPIDRRRDPLRKP